MFNVEENKCMIGKKLLFIVFAVFLSSQPLFSVEQQSNGTSDTQNVTNNTSIVTDSWELAFKLLSDIEVQNLKLETQVKGLEQDLEICQTALASKEVALENSEALCKKWKTTTIVLGTTTITLSIVSAVLTIILVKRK